MKKKVDSFANRLQKAIDESGLKPADVSRKTGISRSSICRYLSGEYEPKLNALDSLALVFNVNEMWLMGYDVPMERVSSPTIANNGNMTIGDSNYIGNEIHANTPLKMDYTEDEKELVEMYRKLSIINRAKVITYIAELGENNGQK